MGRPASWVSEVWPLGGALLVYVWRVDDETTVYQCVVSAIHGKVYASGAKPGKRYPPCRGAAGATTVRPTNAMRDVLAAARRFAAPYLD